MIQKTLPLFFFLLMLYSCKSGHVVRNYEYARPIAIVTFKGWELLQADM